MDPRKRFMQLLQKHLNNGTGRVDLGRTRGQWTDSDVSVEITKLDLTVTSEAVRTWKNGIHFPRSMFKEALATIFFGEAQKSKSNEEDISDRKIFEGAWAEADQFRKSGSEERTGLDSVHPNLEWRVWPGQKTPSIAELSIHAPTPTNEPGTFSLKISLVLSSLETEKDGFPVSIGLQSVNLLVYSDSYQIVPQSTIVDRSKDINFRRIPDGFEIIGPLSTTGKIDGLVLGDEPLTQIETVGTGADPIDISLIATRQSFVVDVSEVEQGDRAPSPNKKHILNAILYDELKRDKFGRVIIADARVRRMEQNADDF